MESEHGAKGAKHERRHEKGRPRDRAIDDTGRRSPGDDDEPGDEEDERRNAERNGPEEVRELLERGDGGERRQAVGRAGKRATKEAGDPGGLLRFVDGRRYVQEP